MLTINCVYRWTFNIEHFHIFTCAIMKSVDSMEKQRMFSKTIKQCTMHTKKVLFFICFCFSLASYQAHVYWISVYMPKAEVTSRMIEHNSTIDQSNKTLIAMRVLSFNSTYRIMNGEIFYSTLSVGCAIYECWLLMLFVCSVWCSVVGICRWNENNRTRTIALTFK